MAGMVLAAGASLRMGAPKALLDAGGTSFLERLTATLGAGGCSPVLVVCADRVGDTAREGARCGAQVVVNPGGQGGQIGSIRAGLRALEEPEPEAAAVVFTPVDSPRVAVETVERLIEAWRTDHWPIVIPEFKGERGHPVLVDRTLFSELLTGDLPEGARTVLRRDPGRVRTLPVSDPATTDDVDTPEEYRLFFSPPKTET